MAFLLWLKDEWFQALQTLSIVSGLLFTAYTVRVDGKSRKVENLLSITASHREIWSALYERPELSRILMPSLDLTQHPVTRDEELFVHSVLLHVSASYQAIKAGLFIKPEGLDMDIGMFLALPIPKSVWLLLQGFYDKDFVGYVESCIRSYAPSAAHPFSAK